MSAPTTHSIFHYTGKDELDALRAMPRYNAHIASLCARGAAPHHRLLDFGAGVGTITDQVRTLSGARIDCIERDAAQAGMLRANGYTVFEDAAAPPDNAYDRIFSSNVLEHVHDDHGVLRILAAKLKPGGTLHFWVPALPILWTRMDDRVEHVRRYTRATLMAAVVQAGLDIETCVYQDFLGIPVTLGLKILEGAGVIRDNPVNPKTLAIYDRYAFPVSRLCDHVFKMVMGKNLFIRAQRAF